MSTPKTTQKLLTALEAAFKQHGLPDANYEISIKPTSVLKPKLGVLRDTAAKAFAEGGEAYTLQIRCYPDGKGGIKCS